MNHWYRSLLLLKNMARLEKSVGNKNQRKKTRREAKTHRFKTIVIFIWHMHDKFIRGRRHGDARDQGQVDSPLTLAQIIGQNVVPVGGNPMTRKRVVFHRQSTNGGKSNVQAMISNHQNAFLLLVALVDLLTVIPHPPPPKRQSEETKIKYTRASEG